MKENKCVICGKKEFSVVEIPHFVCDECSKNYKEGGTLEDRS